jgi:hypothetical protein
LLGVGAFDDLETLSTDYNAFMTTFHQIWTCRIEPVKAANLTDLMEATAHEGPITLNDTQMAALKELHDIIGRTWTRGPTLAATARLKNVQTTQRPSDTGDFAYRSFLENLCPRLAIQLVRMQIRLPDFHTINSDLATPERIESNANPSPTACEHESDRQRHSELHYWITLCIVSDERERCGSQMSQDNGEFTVLQVSNFGDCYGLLATVLD